MARIASFLAASALMASGIAFAPDVDAGTPATASKSVVPSKYAGKYKGGGSGPVPDFIKAQSYENGAIVLDSFFALCRVNIGGSLTEEKIQHYVDLVAAKDAEGKPLNQGAAGKARMTLGNMLSAKARKDGFLLDQAGNKVTLDVPKPPVSGAAAKAQEAAAAEPAETVVETPDEVKETDPDADED